jgi:hypothetical protein
MVALDATIHALLVIVVVRLDRTINATIHAFLSLNP